MSGVETWTKVGAAAGALSLVWNLAQYALSRRVAVRVEAKSERRGGQDGIRIKVENRSSERNVKIGDVEVLHRSGFLRRRVAEVAGPFMEPHTPWVLGPDDDKDGWVALTAVNGSKNGPSSAKWDFSKPIKVRLKLTGRRGPTSRRCKITRTP